MAQRVRTSAAKPKVLSSMSRPTHRHEGRTLSHGFVQCPPHTIRIQSSTVTHRINKEIQEKLRREKRAGGPSHRGEESAMKMVSGLLS